MIDGDLTENQYTFTCRQLDPESGLYHFHFRQYDPTSGVWTTPDPIGILGGMNLYTYVGNNPVNWRDFLGLAMSAGELGVDNPGSYGGENTPDSMYGSNGLGTENDFDGGGIIESVFNRFRRDAISTLDPFFADVDYLLTRSPAPARATLNAAFGLEGFLLGYEIAGPISSKIAEAAYRLSPFSETFIDFLSSSLPASTPSPNLAGAAGAAANYAHGKICE